MGNFADFRKNKKIDRRCEPFLTTCFGSHSVGNKQQNAINEASMYDAQERTAKEHNDIHDSAKMGKLDEDEKSAIHNYCDDSAKLNSDLIGYHEGRDIKARTKTQCDTLDKLLSKHKTSKDFHVYTGLGYSPAPHFSDKVKKGDTATFHLPAFTSTSTSFKQARGFAKELRPTDADEKQDVIPDDTNKVRHILKLQVPAGSHAVSLQKHSFMPIEKEILIHRGHDVEVNAKPQRHIDPRTGHMYHVWHGKLVDHAPSNLNLEDF